MSEAHEPQNIFEMQNMHGQQDMADNENGAYQPAQDTEGPMAEAPMTEAPRTDAPRTDAPRTTDAAGDQRWHDILASFVEDPRSSLQAATEIVTQDASAFIALLGQWQESLPGAAPGDRSGETEKMRQALVIYRDVSRQLETSMRSLG